MNKTNKELIIEKISEEELTLGCWDKKIELLNKQELKKILDVIGFCGSTDVIVMIKNKTYVVEINVVDDEIDFGLLTKKEYISCYGKELFEIEENF